jgi:hypothetical protein
VGTLRPPVTASADEDGRAEANNGLPARTSMKSSTTPVPTSTAADVTSSRITVSKKCSREEDDDCCQAEHEAPADRGDSHRRSGSPLEQPDGRPKRAARQRNSTR